MGGVLFQLHNGDYNFNRRIKTEIFQQVTGFNVKTVFDYMTVLKRAYYLKSVKNNQEFDLNNCLKQNLRMGYLRQKVNENKGLIDSKGYRAININFQDI